MCHFFGNTVERINNLAISIGPLGVVFLKLNIGVPGRTVDSTGPFFREVGTGKSCVNGESK